MNLFKTIKNNNHGMAMVIVLTACFVVLVTVSIGATMIANNLSTISAGSNREKALMNAQSALERVRGMRKADGHLFDACSSGDCVNTAAGGCGPCSGLLYNVGDNQHRVRLESLTQPYFDGRSWLSGSASLLATGYYKNTEEKRTSNFCLNYCVAAGYNCGHNGCGGECGTCSGGQSCTDGVCSGGATSCNNVTAPCDDACVQGDTCGGGTVVNADLNIVAVLGGCKDTSGTMCGEADDQATASWDNSGGHYEQTNANDDQDGRTNIATLTDIDMNRFDAAKFCDDLRFSGFSDWYLPANKEVNFKEIRDNSWASNFADGCYWSSFETSTDNAASFDMAIMSPCALGDKSDRLYVRCIRRY